MKETREVRRRDFLAIMGGVGAGVSVPERLWADASVRSGRSATADLLPVTVLADITLDDVRAAERLIGLEFTDSERELMLEGLEESLQSYQAMREVLVPNEIAPAFTFDPAPGYRARGDTRARFSRPPVELPGTDAEIAFLPVTHLAELIRSKQISSVELTSLYLRRLREHGPTLECIVTVTEDLAMRQARRADREISLGRYRGPLHGIPWGAKDLLATRDYPTTWGALPYREQSFDSDATVVRKLEDAGAVLVAKLTLGALAWGDVWFGGRTRNPWNLEQGSSGSSAGPAAATSAGLVGFSIGSETWGSIVSPSTRCGTTGLRPTFGAVSRHGAMALSWTMDKIGPICRTAEDCAIVLDAIRGRDPMDPTTREIDFAFDALRDPRSLRVGYVPALFEADYPNRQHDRAALDALLEAGLRFHEVSLPDELPINSLNFILSAEAAAAFDDLTRSDRDDLMVRQIANAWPNVFRQSRFIPAVEYIQANRIRSMAVNMLNTAMDHVDVLLSPSFGGDILLRTNLTGHPACSMPSGFRDGTPVSISVIGRTYQDADVALLARTFQQVTDHHTSHPPMFG